MSVSHVWQGAWTQVPRTLCWLGEDGRALPSDPGQLAAGYPCLPAAGPTFPLSERHVPRTLASPHASLPSFPGFDGREGHSGDRLCGLRMPCSVPLPPDRTPAPAGASTPLHVGVPAWGQRCVEGALGLEWTWWMFRGSGTSPWGALGFGLWWPSLCCSAGWALAGSLEWPSLPRAPTATPAARLFLRRLPTLCAQRPLGCFLFLPGEP